ncbi:MAG: flagellar assembly protein FliW [Eubacteriales bacterium]|nr:flagellar assembly protein FliW [Eubacteriales bacterium]
MEINTRDFGLIKVEEDAIYEFGEGLYGFENEKRFAIFEKSFEDISFLYLQSFRHLDPCFLVFEPWELYPDYQPLLSDDDMEACQADTADDLIFLVIATVPSSIENLSINIKSPVVLNPKTKKGRQVILQNKDYSVRYLPFQKDGKAGS